MLTVEQRRKTDEARRKLGKPPLTDKQANSPSAVTDGLSDVLGAAVSSALDGGSCDGGGGGGGCD